jgi:probable F420-dependent oxidoreductase
MKIGFVVLTAEDQSSGHTPSYTDIRAMALQAEEAGFDSIWLYDHLLYRYEGQPAAGIWECWTTLTALAEATKEITMGTLVACNQFRSPAVLAKMAVTLQEVSAGRFILGIGAGWHRPEFDAFGIPFDRRVARLEEAVQVIKSLLIEGQADFTGEYYQLRNCEMIPRPPVDLPLMIGGFGPRMLRLAARYGDMWNRGYFGPPHTLHEPLDQFKTACTEVGRDFETIKVTALVALAFPELARPPHFMVNYLTGSTEELAQAFTAYEALGVSHLMVHCSPYNEATLQRLAEGVHMYRRLNKVDSCASRKV